MVFDPSTGCMTVNDTISGDQNNFIQSYRSLSISIAALDTSRFEDVVVYCIYSNFSDNGNSMGIYREL